MRRCKKVMGVVLVMVMMMGFAVSAYANGNTISFGGASATWSMTSSNLKITVTNRNATSLQTRGMVYGFDSGNHKTETNCGASINQSTRLYVNVKPENGYTFKYCASNKVTVLVSGRSMVTFDPQP